MKISAKQLHEEAKSGDIKLVDVRTPVEYGAEHIEGAQSMPLHELKPEELKGPKCVTICASGKRATKAAEQLKNAGCNDVRVLEGGMTAWKQVDLPVNKGKAVMSLERQVRIAAGILVLLGVILGTWVHPAFYGLAAFVGAGLTFAGITDWCGMGMLLAKAPWNQRNPATCST